MNLVRLRRALALRGLAPASGTPESSGGRVDEATIRPAERVEDAALSWHDARPAAPCAEIVAFLDGIQQSEVVGYAGSSPLVVARVAAAVRERRDGRLTTAVVERRTVAIGRPEVLAAAGPALDGCATVALATDEPPHPVRDRAAASRATDDVRSEAERSAGARYRAGSPHWLIVDGSLAERPAWALDRRMIGVSKSHASLPFDGDELERYLRLPEGHRSSLFVPASRSIAPVRAWALRLWAWEGRDLLHGLVRVEVAPINGIPATADALSSWLLAERAPISAPDRRWDRLLYGIHSVEEYLRALGPA